MSKQQKKTQKTQKTVKMGSGECVLELPIPGKPRNQIIPLRETGIQFPKTRINPLREYGIYYKTEHRDSGQEGYSDQPKVNCSNLE